jgi:hypothetical protein
MDVRWYCYRFGYAEYVRLRPALRAAATAGALEAVAPGPEVEAIAEALLAGEIALGEARAALVQACCCFGEPLPFDAGLPRIVSTFERIDGMEEAAQLLTGLLSGGRNMEPWLRPSAGLTGFLTPQETSALYVAFVSWRGRTYRRRRGGGGLLPALGGLIRNLLGGGPQPEETLRLLGHLLDDAVRHDAGIAAVAAQTR